VWRQDKYSDIANRFKECLPRSNQGDFVEDFALDFLNRANRSLNAYRPWKLLVKKRQTLTLTDRANVLTTTYPDLARIISVYEDTNADGLPDTYYYEKASSMSRGYCISESYSKDTGWARTLTFYSSPSDTVYIDYIALLPDFTGTETEYSFFPGELLFAKAMILYLEFDGRVGTTEYKLLQNRFIEEERDFTQAQVENYDIRMEPKDDAGNPVFTDSYSLGGGSESTGTSRYEPDVDL